MTANPTRTVSTPLRLTGILIAVFVAVLLISFAASYLVIRNSFDDTLRDQVQARMADYLALPGAQDRSERLQAESASADPGLILVDYRPATGPRVSNVESLPVVNGFAVLSETEIKGEDIDDSYLALGVAVDGGHLTLALTRAQMVDMGEIFLTVLLISLLPTLAIASGLGWVFARRARNRIDRIGAALLDLQGGDLSARVPLDPADRDDLAAIGRAVNAMAGAQEAAMSALRQTTTDIAHDLKTPIQRVAVTLDRLARRTTLAPGQREFVEQAQAETDHIAKTFDALLRIAQIEGGALRKRFKPVDLQALAGDMVEMFAASAEESGHVLTLSATSPCMVPGDRELLGQVLANLIENCLRHVPQGGKIAVSLTQSNGHAVLEVADDGPGIPKAERGNVLRRLYRLETSRSTPGNGLGLSMVAAICDLHGATLHLGDNAPGLRVTITFPTQR